MVKKFEDRIPQERKKLVPTVEELRSRIKESPYGPKTKALLEKWLEYDSIGEVGFGLFRCPPIIERGSGATVVDADGKEYLDLLSGFSVNNLGHCNEETIEAIKDQSQKLLQYFGVLNIPQIELSQKLCRMTPGNFPKKAIYGGSGSETIEAAMKLARWYTGKPFILVPYGDYHGKTAGAQALTPKGGWTYHYPILPADSGIAYFPYPYCYRCSFDKSYPNCKLWCLDYLERLLTSQEAPFSDPGTKITNVAAIIIEPMQSSAGYIIPPKEYLSKLHTVCQRHDILLVVDEIQSGMGRTGKMWACEHSGITPDMITLGKALGGGLPISALVGRAEILDSWGPGGFFGTFSGNPLSCAVACKTLEIMKRDKFPARVAEKGRYFLEGLRNLAKKRSLIGQVDGIGLYLSMELVKDRKTRQPAANESSFMMTELLKDGLICELTGYYHNRFNLIPSFVISRTEIDKALEIFDKVIGQVESKFK